MVFVRLKLKDNPFLDHRFPKRSNGFSATMPTTVKCSLDNSEDLIAKIKERMNKKFEFSASAYQPASRVGTVPAGAYSVVEHRNPMAACWGGLQSKTAVEEEEVCNDLCLVDHIQDLGVDRFFQSEIQHILHHTFRLWQQKDEQVFEDVTCRAMAFRLLRLEGYHVSSGELGECVHEENFFRTVRLEWRGTETVLELYKASQVRLPDDDDVNILENLHDWTFNFLKEQLKCKTILDKGLERKVEFYLKNYHGILDAVKHRRSLDHTRFWKTSAYNPAVYDEYLFRLSAQDFMTRQAQNQKELEMLLRWYDECRLDKMEYGRNVIRVSHFLNANNFPDPRLSEARLSFAKTMTLVTRLDDFFDHHGSREDSVLIIELIRQWNEPSTITTRFPSEEVEILYSALHSTVTDIAEKAYPIQGRCIKSLIIHLWVEILSSFMSEMDSCTAETPPDMDEYLGFAWISIGCRICILVAIHFLGEKVSQQMVMGAECTELCRHVSSIARLLNDLQTFQKEREERKVNSVIIQLKRGTMTEEAAVSNIEKMVEYHRKELLKMVVRREGSLVPKRCKDVFWKSCNIAHYLYTFTDEFTLPQQMKEDMKLLFRDPVNYALLP